MFKYIFPICAILSTSLFSTHAMETAPFFDKGSEGFSAFKGLTHKKYIEKCMPGLTQNEQAKATKIFNKLASQMTSPILGGTNNSINNFNKLLPEAGLNFPPFMEIQGPLLLNCAKKPVKHVMNIGPGKGNDDIMMLCTNNVQIIAADIYPAQLAQLKDNVKINLGDLPTSTFFAHIKNYADEKTELLEKFKNGFEIVNANKMLHFLTDEETQTFLKNMDALLKKGGRLYLTVSMPTPNSDADKKFKNKKDLGADCPGLIYYDEIKDLNNPMAGYMPGKFEILPEGAPDLPSPGHKIMYFNEVTKTHILRMGRYLHDIDTLTPYLDPYFHILDSTVVNYGDAYFLSVIAEKR